MHQESLAVSLIIFLCLSIAVGAIIERKFPDTELNFYTFPWQSRIRDNVLSFISTEQLAFSFMKSLQKKNLNSHRNLQMYSRVSNNRT